MHPSVPNEKEQKFVFVCMIRDRKSLRSIQANAQFIDLIMYDPTKNIYLL